MKKWMIIFFLTLLIAGCANDNVGNYLSGKTVQEKNKLDVNKPKIFIFEEVAKHNSEKDCWIALHGKVYDVTNFIAKGIHNKEILQGCGKDATVYYETRPMGSGTPHSEKAREMSVEYYIGEIA